MIDFYITENSKNPANLAYVYSQLPKYLSLCSAKSLLSENEQSAKLSFCVDESYSSYLRRIAEDKVAEAIVINYKYQMFKKNLKVTGLSEKDKNILICSIISADFEDDKAYVKSKISSFDNYSMDGIFNFRLKPLKNKWQEIINYIPGYFNEFELEEFMKYLIGEYSENKIYIKNSAVFDKNYLKLNRSNLIDENNNENHLIKDIILSSATQIECIGKLKEEEYAFLKKYYTNRVVFS